MPIWPSSSVGRVFQPRRGQHRFGRALSRHANHSKRSMPNTEALCIVCFCSNVETVRLRGTDLVDCMVKRCYNVRKTNIQIERDFNNFVIPPALSTLLYSFTLVYLT